MSLRLLIDVCLAQWIAELLEERGHDCVYMGKLRPHASDEQIAQRAVTLKAVVVTHDWDFGDLIVRRRVPTLGAVIVDMASFQDEGAIERLTGLLRDYEATFEGRLTILRRRRVRQRPAPGYTRPIA